MRLVVVVSNALWSPVELPQPLWQDMAVPRYQPNRTAWLVSFVDLTALLLAFFVLLFSTQTLQRDKWEAVTGSFREQFAPRTTVVPMVAEGGDNAVVRVTGVKSGLAYLDTLLLQRMETDPVWSTLQALREQGGMNGELRYALPKSALEGAGVHDAWLRLGGVVRGWKNSVGIRVTAPAAAMQRYADQGAVLTQKMHEAGAVTSFTELMVKEGEAPKLELVVRSQ
ncbi:MAG: hypothetical protein EON60_00790 [Alphaproteobacteria bacterium]|nr:MAG: hypothetical protein EON60_00790 [Alphaproteobacteria bacterium]